MDAHVKVGSTWKTLNGIHVKVGSTWKEVKKAYVKVGAAWKQFYTFATVILTGTTGTPNVDNSVGVGDPQNAGWSFLSTGDLTKVSGSAWAQPEWYGEEGETTHLTPDQTYYIRATLDADDTPTTGPTLGTWHSLATTRTWTWTQTGGLGSYRGTLKIEISSDASGTPIVDTGYYRGYAEIVT